MLYGYSAGVFQQNHILTECANVTRFRFGRGLLQGLTVGLFVRSRIRGAKRGQSTYLDRMRQCDSLQVWPRASPGAYCGLVRPIQNPKSSDRSRRGGPECTSCFGGQSTFLIFERLTFRDSPRCLALILRQAPSLAARRSAGDCSLSFVEGHSHTMRPLAHLGHVFVGRYAHSGMRSRGSGSTTGILARMASMSTCLPRSARSLK